MYPVADIERLIEPSLASLGFRLVRVRLSGKHRPVLQVMVERAEAQGLSPDVGVDDCAEISRMLSALLDVEEPVRGSYMLEVSTPGIDRPLLAKQDFERFAGFDARVETHELFEGRRRFKGRLKGVVGEAVRVELDDDGAIDLPLAEIARAKLLLSDALIAAVQREKKDRQSGPNDG